MTKLFMLSLFGFFLACGGGGNSNSGIEGIIANESYAYEEAKYAEDEIEQDVEGSPTTVNAPREAKIIKNANLAFESADPEKTHKNILSLVAQNKGFIASDNAGKDYNRIYRNMVVRVPTENFQTLVHGISEGVPYFDQKAISRKDVTEEFVDLEARLSAKRELEKRYLELLKQARTVKEMLEIERELSTIREEIEAKQGRLKYLQDRVSMSTISIQFYKYTSETGVTLSYGQKMKNALQGGWDGISVFFLGLLYIWPLFVVIIFAIFFIRWLVRRNKKN